VFDLLVATQAHCKITSLSTPADSASAIVYTGVREVKKVVADALDMRQTT
jgi:hypothetical protein